MDRMDEKFLYDQIAKLVLNAKDQAACADYASREIDPGTGMDLLDSGTFEPLSINNLKIKVKGYLQGSLSYINRALNGCNDQRALVEQALESEGVSITDIEAQMEGLQTYIRAADAALGNIGTKQDLINAFKPLKENRPRIYLVRRPWGD